MSLMHWSSLILLRAIISSFIEEIGKLLVLHQIGYSDCLKMCDADLNFA